MIGDGGGCVIGVYIKRLVGLVTRGCNTASGNFSCLWTTESSVSFK